MTALHFAEALLPGGWAKGVSVHVTSDGLIESVDTNQQGGVGIAIPGVPNCHSHAFQRAMAGLTERAGLTNDSFWTWRELMYRFAGRIGPEELEAIAAQLYVEMLKGGYTSVAEFHYLHHDPKAEPYADRAELSNRVITAAQSVGIAITHLPVLYRYGGFGELAPSDGQARFINSAAGYLEILEVLHAQHHGNANVRIGIAPHSLRAVSEPLLQDVVAAFDKLDDTAPIHIHIAEQTGEVEDCLTSCGARPVAWLMDHFDVGDRWCLIHATHMDDSEVAALARSGAVAGICPTTEANLGDGLFPARAFFDLNGKLAIGSDSNVTLNAAEELRLLEYGQRLVLRGRNILADGPGKSTGLGLYNRVAKGGAQALGQKTGKIAPGYRADFVVLDPDHPSLMDRDGDAILDSLIFASMGNPIRDVYVGGAQVISDGRHEQEDKITLDFQNAIKRLT